MRIVVSMFFLVGLVNSLSAEGPPVVSPQTMAFNYRYYVWHQGSQSFYLAQILYEEGVLRMEPVRGHDFRSFILDSPTTEELLKTINQVSGSRIPIIQVKSPLGETHWVVPQLRLEPYINPPERDAKARAQVEQRLGEPWLMRLLRNPKDYFRFFEARRRLFSSYRELPLSGFTGTSADVLGAFLANHGPLEVFAHHIRRQHPDLVPTPTVVTRPIPSARGMSAREVCARVARILAGLVGIW